jgi:hypothetical protein
MHIFICAQISCVASRSFFWHISNQYNLRRAAYYLSYVLRVSSKLIFLVLSAFGEDYSMWCFPLRTALRLVIFSLLCTNVLCYTIFSNILSPNVTCNGTLDCKKNTFVYKAVCSLTSLCFNIMNGIV